MSEETQDFWKRKYLSLCQASETGPGHKWKISGITAQIERKGRTLAERTSLLCCSGEGAGTEKGLGAERQILGILRTAVKKKKNLKRRLSSTCTRALRRTGIKITRVKGQHANCE